MLDLNDGAGRDVEVRVSSTCTIWTSPEEFRIRARLLPGWPIASAGFVFGAGSVIISLDRAYAGAVLTGVIAALCFCLTVTSYYLSAGLKGFRTWISLGPLRYSSFEIPPANVVEVLASSIHIKAYGTTYHHLQLRRDRDLPKTVLTFGVAPMRLAAAGALARWLNENRGPGSQAVGLKTDGVIYKKSREK